MAEYIKYLDDNGKVVYKTADGEIKGIPDWRIEQGRRDGYEIRIIGDDTSRNIPNRPVRKKAAPPVKRKPTPAVVRKTPAVVRPTKPQNATTFARPKSKQAPKTVRPQSGKVDISSSLRPWTERTNPTQFWAGLSEKDALEKAQDVHNFIQGNSRKGKEWAEQFVQHELKFDNRSASKFANDAMRGKKVSRFADIGEAHTAAGEEMFADWMGQSRGNATELLNQISGEPTATDLRSGRDLVDVQNRYYRGKPDSIGIAVMKGHQGSNPTEFYSSQPDDKMVGDIIEDFKRRSSHGDDKLLQTPDGAAIGRNDRNMQRNADIFGKDYLIGGTYDPDKYESLVDYRRGPYNPTVPSRVYGVNLPELREDVFSRTKGELRDLGVRTGNTGTLKLDLPFDYIKEKGGGTNPVKMGLISEEVADAISKARPGGVDFSAQIVPGVDEVGKGLKQNWKGGVAGTVLSGASGEAAKKLVKGDVAGAAGEVATNYAIGAVGESALKKAATSGIGKRIGGAVAKRIPAAISRFAGASAGSGGLLAPVMAVAAAADIADGVSEGLTGKGVVENVSDNALERRRNSKDRTINSDKAERSGAFIHSEANPVTISGPSRPTTARGWWDKALDSLGL